MIIAAQPICVAPGCTRPAVDVDHIDNDPFNNAIENLQAFCKKCHGKKTRNDYAK